MSKKMTPCEKLGYKVGDKFEVISRHAFKKGQVVTLHEDDGTGCPLFAGDGGDAGVFDGVECSFATLNQHVRKIANKLKPAKQALADAIHQNGGWVDGSGFASQDKVGSDHDGSDVCFYKYEPIFTAGKSMWNSNKPSGCVVSSFKTCVIIKNWHQTVLRREEYYHAYPKADADGWIDHNGKSNPVWEMDVVDVLFGNGRTSMSMCAGKWNWGWAGKSSASGFLIEKYRLHKPDVKPEFCESVTRSIPGSESIDELCAKVTEENKHQHVDAKPTIEQLAQGYRNKLDFANSKQQEADVEAKLTELVAAGKAIGLLVSPIATHNNKVIA